MKIAIHQNKGSFSENWIKYCISNNVDFKLVNCRDNNILHQIENCEGLMWHWDPEESQYAIALTYALEKMGIRVFPNHKTCWHFDNKIFQKYLLDSAGVATVPTFIFYDKHEAYKWLETASLPLVFKLKNGASSVNVKLVKTRSKAKKLVNKAFTSGFHPIDRLSVLKNQIWRFRRDKSFRTFLGVVNGLRLLFWGIKLESIKDREKGYIYFQKFIPNNSFDIRIIVIGDKAIAVRRNIRKNDFRASGSGLKVYDPKIFDKRLFSISFKLAKDIGMQSLACDFIFDENNSPLLVEISYGFITGSFYEDCMGFWTDDLIWHNEKVLPEKLIIENFINELKTR